MKWTKETESASERQWEEFYRNRLQHDKRVRTTHGVNCTGSCSWKVYVKDGIVTLGDAGDGLPQARGLVAALRAAGLPARHQLLLVSVQPAARQVPLCRAASCSTCGVRPRSEHPDPVDAWALAHGTIREAHAGYSRRAARAGSGARRGTKVLELIAASTVYTVKKYGPDRVVGFSPIPAMSQISYAAGSRFLTLLGGVVDEFLRLVLRPAHASPEMWGEQTDVHESADWYNAKLHRRDGVEPQHDSHA